ncbi:hypothetical protein BDK51DRAFT_37202 [Blyttiomyces helicus]|uniref:Uncharacterized protein n=1 Tax=Blyttiomyces helicus TaxID=388810 RepID=A0A4P9W6J8_9FUNG|nr:hypothetical protein BDK51DRAFT_37202 [Blyttiomyces helicus]|eukprot:RKO86993.1 hypothetical protein BDK51DRAFT_37202 [Blyttiomyces helicus]
MSTISLKLRDVSDESRLRDKLHRAPRSRSTEVADLKRNLAAVQDQLAAVQNELAESKRRVIRATAHATMIEAERKRESECWRQERAEMEKRLAAAEDMGWDLKLGKQTLRKMRSDQVADAAAKTAAAEENVKVERARGVAAEAIADDLAAKLAAALEDAATQRARADAADTAQRLIAARSDKNSRAADAKPLASAPSAADLEDVKTERARAVAAESAVAHFEKMLDAGGDKLAAAVMDARAERSRADDARSTAMTLAANLAASEENTAAERARADSAESTAAALTTHLESTTRALSACKLALNAATRHAAESERATADLTARVATLEAAATASAADTIRLPTVETSYDTAKGAEIEPGWMECELLSASRGEGVGGGELVEGSADRLGDGPAIVHPRVQLPAKEEEGGDDEWVDVSTRR